MRRNFQFGLIAALALGALASVARAEETGADKKTADAPKSEATAKTKPKEKKMEIATVGGGCFWCVEAVYQRIKGVETVKSGYSGGKVKNPTYEQVCTGQTGHAEAVQIMFDPSVVSYEKLMELFFIMHDPTTLNRQGADEGTQYRSVIFYHDEEQKKTAEAVKKRINDEKKYKDPIVTEIARFDAFYEAEGHHQNYYNQNANGGYCRAVITPKLKKLGLETK